MGRDFLEMVLKVVMVSTVVIPARVIRNKQLLHLSGTDDWGNNLEGVLELYCEIRAHQT